MIIAKMIKLISTGANNITRNTAIATITVNAITPITMAPIAAINICILMNNGELQCLLDEGRSDCVHVGFVYSLPELYGIISSKGIKVPSSALLTNTTTTAAIRAGEISRVAAISV